MMTRHISRSTTPLKLLVSGVAGVIAGLIFAALHHVRFALIGGLDVAMAVYVVWVWVRVLPLSPVDARSHAVREDPGRAAADIILIIASLVSLAAVILYLLHAGHASGLSKAADIIAGIVSIIVSWFLVHTTFALKYARLYYGARAADVDFNEKDPPTYADFAYLAFTLGMTFQVSDTDIRTKEMRGTVLKHALLSYVFGTVIIATTINMIASLSS